MIKIGVSVGALLDYFVQQTRRVVIWSVVGLGFSFANAFREEKIGKEGQSTAVSVECKTIRA